MRMKEEGDRRTDDNITEFAPKGEREGVREDKEGGKGDERESGRAGGGGDKKSMIDRCAALRRRRVPPLLPT